MTRMTGNFRTEPGDESDLPASAEPAQQFTASASAPEPQPKAQTGQEAQTQIPQKSPENAAARNFDRGERAQRRKRYAERKAKRIAAAKARQRMEQQQRTEPGILAFGNDDAPSPSSETQRHSERQG